VLGRGDDTLGFLRRCLAHPVLAGRTEADSSTLRSLRRGMAVVLLLAGRPDDARSEADRGCADDAERCRYAVLAAQSLAARGRPADAVPFLVRGAELARALPPTDEVRAIAGTVGANLLRLAEPQALLAHELLRGAGALINAASLGEPDTAWRRRHQALWLQGRALLVAGDPVAALACVGEMMQIEDAHAAQAQERFHTAALAARAQLMRGQRKLAAGALEAARDFAGRLDGAAAAAAQKALNELAALAA
jgi:hypothetical protein